VIGRVWKPREDIAQIFVRIDAVRPAGLNDRVDDGATLAGVCLTKEEAVLFLNGLKCLSDWGQIGQTCPFVEGGLSRGRSLE